MTNIDAAAYMVTILGHESAPAAPSAAALRGQRKTGIVAWLCRSAIGKALADRLAKRALDRAIARLAATSPHLLADIGLIDRSERALDMTVRARLQAVSDETQVSARPIPAPSAASVPFAPRPGMRPAIVVAVGKPAPASIARPAALR